MNYRHMVLASLIASVTAGCSLFQKDQPNDAADQVIPETTRVDLIELKASSRAQVPAAHLSNETASQAPLITRKRVEFLIGGQDINKESAGSITTAASGPVNRAPSYPGRPVPSHGASKELVLSELGQPPHKIPGKGGSEVWDYGTFRVFFQYEKVAFTKVW